MATATRIPKLRSSQILRYMRVVLTESAGSTFTEKTLDTQLSIERGVVMLIHQLEISILPSAFSAVTADSNETFTMQITRTSQSALIDIDDPDSIIRYAWEIRRMAAIGTDAGPMYLYWKNPMFLHFPIPIPYAGANIFAAIQTTNAAAQTGRLRIGYTLAEVSDKEFFRIANAILT
jgi:hypothetical protein